MKYIKYIFIVIFLILFVGCFNTFRQTMTTKPNIANIYNPSSTTVHPKFLIYNTNDSVSMLYIYIYTPELWFIHTDIHDDMKAKIKIKYKVMLSFENPATIDSASRVLTIKKNEKNSSLITYLELNPIKHKKYIIQIYGKDLIRNTSFLSYIYVDKSNDNSAQNYILKYPDTFKPVFNRYISKETDYKIEFNKTGNNFSVTHYNLDTTLARPPYSTSAGQNKFVKDSVYNFNINNLFSVTKKGIYYIQSDKKQEAGKTVVNFYNNYPLIKSSEQMLEPLQYLTSKTEFAEMKQQVNKKIAIDEFWLQTTDNIQHAKELLRIYYSRVLYANIYFTSYKQGWKTDRGMIYIIFGPPKYLYKGDNYEKWVYQDKNSSKMFTLEFIKKEHRFSDNNFILRRDIKYKKYWQNAINSWRNGRIF